MQQRRLLLALILSSAILFLWTYFYPAPSPKNQQQQEAAAMASPTAAPTASPQAPVATTTPSTSTITSTAINQAPQRTITVRTDLYEVKFDTRGAEPISWIIKKNRYSNTDIYSVAGRKSQRIPLQLISPEGLNRQPRQVPFQLQTGDPALDSVLASSTYRVEGVDTSANGDLNLNLGAGEKKQLTFVLEDANGLQDRKTIVLDAEKYETDLSLLVKRGDAVVPQVKVTIGPSIGDQ